MPATLALRRCLSSVSAERRTCTITGRPAAFARASCAAKKRSPRSQVEPGHEVVQADLADGHEARVVAVPARGGRPARRGRRRPRGRRTAGGCPARSDRPCWCASSRTRVEVERAHGLQHQHLHAGGLAAGHHRIAVGVELGGVEVAVGVDPGHGVMMPSRFGRARPPWPSAYAVQGGRTCQRRRRTRRFRPARGGSPALGAACGLVAVAFDIHS